MSSYKECFMDLLSGASSITHGKQMYFQQSNGTLYSRVSHQYLAPGDAIDEYLEQLKTIVE